MVHEIRSALDPYSPEYREARLRRLYDDLKRRIDESETPLDSMLPTNAFSTHGSRVGFVSTASGDMMVKASVDVLGGTFHLDIQDFAGENRGMSFKCSFDLMYDSEVLSLCEDALIYAYLGR